MRSRRLLSVAAVVLLLAPSAALGGGSPSAVGPADRLELAVLDHLNALRLEAGLRPLRVNSRLAAAAEQHSLEMVQVGYFAHESADGGPFWKRIRRFYPRARSGRWVVGENMMWRAPWLSARLTVQAWLESPRHREILYRPYFRDVGVGAVRAAAAPGVYGSRKVIVVTVDFGSR